MTDQEIIEIAKKHMEYSVMHGFVGEPSVDSVIDFARAILATTAPKGWKLVPIVPTEKMVVEGFESAPDPHFSEPEIWEEYEAMSGCQQAAFRAELCWAAMLDVAPPFAA